MTFDQVSFDAAASRVCEAFRLGEVPDSDDLGVVALALETIVRGRFRTIPEDAAHDVVQDAFLAFLKAARGDKIDCGRAAPYLIRIAINEALDFIEDNKRTEHHVPIDSEEVVSILADQILVEAISDEQEVWENLAKMKADGKHLCVRVIATWLNLAARDGQSPSSRRVAKKLDVSHTTVIDCLQTFRTYFSR